MSTTTPDVGEIGLNVATQTVAELTLTGEPLPHRDPRCHPRLSGLGAPAD